MKTHESKLKIANALLRAKKYSVALEIYNSLLISKHALSHNIGFNRRLAQCRLKASRLKHSLLGVYNIKSTNYLEARSDQKWVSTGEDPNFILDSKEIFQSSEAWYQIELLIKAPRKRFVSKLYIDNGDGFNEDESVSLFIDNNKLTKQIIHLQKVPNSIRFDPIDKPGSLEIHVFHISPLSQEDALNQMISCIMEKKLLNTQGPPDAAMSIVKEKARQAKQNPTQFLYSLYSKALVPPVANVEYADWIDAVETPSLPTETEIQKTLQLMLSKPLISVVVPVYNTPEIYLRACIESVLAQSYPHWELCIADDCSPEPHVQVVLQEYAVKDKRIRFTRRQTNGHISLASNSALELASGDFVALLDHDDLLSKHALYFTAQAINEHPEAIVIYSDEDKVDAYGNRSEPHFKSDWNPDLFFSQNYVSHLGVYRRNILEAIGGFRKGVEGSQDQDLLLRCLPHAGLNQIIHLPRVLYHWRALEGSTALSAGEKSYTTEAGIKALRDYFANNGPEGIEVEAGPLANTYRVRWPITNPPPRVSLLIPTRDKKEITEVAVRSILEKTSYPNYEIVILDNGSTEPETLAFFEAIQQEDERVRILRYDHPFNYSAINNFGVAHTHGEIIGLINNDVEVISSEWLSEMVSHAARQDIGCVGAKLYYSNDTLQHGGVLLGIGGIANHAHKNFSRNHPGYFARLIVTQNYSAVTAACLIVRREIYEAVNGLDEKHLKVAFNDVDFCLKVREAGYRNLWTPYAELYHHESISRGHEDTPEKQKRFQLEVETMKKRWGQRLGADPYYSPNLTRDREDFSLNTAAW